MWIQPWSRCKVRRHRKCLAELLMWASRSKLSAELRNKPGLSIRNSTMRSSFLRIQHSVHDSIIISKNTSTSSPEMLKAGVCQAAMPGIVMSKASPEHLNMAAMKPGTPAKLSRTIKRHSTALTWESLAGTTRI